MSTHEVLDEKHSQALIDSVGSVFEQMVMMKPDSVTVAEDPQPNVVADVIGVLGFTGTKTGLGVLSCSLQLAQTVCANMLMMEVSEISSEEEVTDSFGELVNMVVGNFKNHWVAEGNIMDLAVPSVTLGSPISMTTHKETTAGYSAVFTFDSQELRVDMRFHE